MDTSKRGSKSEIKWSKVKVTGNENVNNRFRASSSIYRCRGIQITGRNGLKLKVLYPKAVKSTFIKLKLLVLPAVSRAIV